ncbi:MAG: hypothetical protein IJW64_01765 [Clostridia bacterium]|nr:hypothetical protein [Clostridia bacterium]
MKNSKKSLLIVLAIALVLSVCATLGIWINDIRVQGTTETPSLSGGEVEAEYLLGEYTDISSATLTFGGQTQDAKITVVKPNGEKVASSKVYLTEGGIYTVEYSAVFSGKTHVVTKDFTVKIPMFSSSTGSSSFEPYGEDKSQYATGIKGVALELTEGDRVDYNGVIDLRESNGKVMEFFMTPEGGMGTADFRKLTITLTDFHNPDISLTVIVQSPAIHSVGAGEEMWYFNYTYCLAGGQNQTPTGMEGNKKHVGGDWGAATRFSFYGQHHSAGSEPQLAVGQESLTIEYNEAENAVYVNNTKVVTLDNLDQFDTEWTGFTTGEVTMSLMAEKFNIPFGNIMITKIGANNLNVPNGIMVDNQAPEITVDFDGYDENNLPKAGKGLSYPVFSASALDMVAGVVPVSTKVYYNYESQQRSNVQIKNGRFSTSKTGKYTIEYKAVDGFRNERVKLVEIECVTATADLTVDSVGSYVTSGKTGELIFPAEIAYLGGTGKVRTFAIAKAPSGEEIAIDEGFRPEESGVYEIALCAEDMLGKLAKKTYDLEIDVNTEPVFIDDVLLPRYFLKGYKYELPTLTAYDYSSGKEEVATTISVVDGNGTTDLTGNVATFVADANGYATVVYKATGKQGNNTKEYKVRVIDTWRNQEEYTLDMGKYFYGEGITSVADENCVVVSSTTDVEYEFINPVIADKFEMSFAITKGNFDYLTIILEDSVDSSVKIEIEIERALGNTNLPLTINGKAMRDPAQAGFNDGGDFNFFYESTSNVLSNDASFKYVVKNEDGSVFGGFPSGKIYVRVIVKDVEYGETAEVSWKNFGGQSLKYNEYDSIKPFVSILGNYKSSYQLGEVGEIFPAIAADVLSPELITSLTVYDPAGNVVKDVDGLELLEVPFNRSYFINLEVYGGYSIVYWAQDYMEETIRYYRALYVTDSDAPVITLDGELKTEVKQGKKITIVNATAKDNLDEKVDVYAYVVTPSGIIERVELGGKYKVTEKGVYRIRYMSIDSYGNMRIDVYEITVV